MRRSIGVRLLLERHGTATHTPAPGNHRMDDGLFFRGRAGSPASRCACTDMSWDFGGHVARNSSSLFVRWWFGHPEANAAVAEDATGADCLRSGLIASHSPVFEHQSRTLCAGGPTPAQSRRPVQAGSSLLLGELRNGCGGRVLETPGSPT